MSALEMKPRKSAPRAAPTTVPEPPKMLTPPTTTAAMTWSVDAGRGRGVDRPELDAPHDAGDARPAARRREKTTNVDEPGADAEDRRAPRGCCRPHRPGDRTRVWRRTTPAIDHDDDRDDDEDRDPQRCVVARRVGVAGRGARSGSPACRRRCRKSRPRIDAQRPERGDDRRAPEGPSTRTPLNIPRTSPSPTPNGHRDRHVEDMRLLEEVGDDERDEPHRSPRPRGRRCG